MNTGKHQGRDSAARSGAGSAYPPGITHSALAGAITVVLAAMSFTAATTPEEFWLPMKNVAATWLGVDALIGGAGTIVLGFATHFGNSIGWGVVLAVLVARLRNSGLVFLAGVLWGAVVVYVLMTWLALPFLDPTMSARVAVQPAWWWWMLHLIFGVTLGAVLAARPWVRQG